MFYTYVIYTHIIYVLIYINMPAYVSTSARHAGGMSGLTSPMRVSSTAFVSLYVAYVSIPQYTSAYVSRRVHVSSTAFSS